MTSILFCKETNCNPNILMIQCIFLFFSRFSKATSSSSFSSSFSYSTAVLSFNVHQQLSCQFSFSLSFSTAVLTLNLSTLTLAPAGVDLRFIIQHSSAAPPPIFVNVNVIVHAKRVFIHPQSILYISPQTS